MKVGKRHIIYIVLFFVVVFLVYVLITTFSFNTLTFKNFFKSKVITETDEKITNYTLSEDNDIIYTIKDDKVIKINKIQDNNVDLKTLMVFNCEEIEKVDSFERFGKNYYLFYNNGHSMKIIDIENLSFKTLKNNGKEKIVINPFDNENQVYLFNDENKDLTHLIYDEDKQIFIYNYVMNVGIQSEGLIKDVIFLSENELICSTYTKKLYNVDITTSSIFLYDNEESFIDLKVYDGKIYYTFIASDGKLGIKIIHSKDKSDTSLIKRVDALSMQIKNDYLYLICKDQIIKFSLKRLKKNETLTISNYEDYSYDLQDILIVNEKLMYLPMIETNNEEGKVYYSHALLRYKI